MKLTELELQRLRDLSADAVVFGLSGEEAEELQQLQSRATQTDAQPASADLEMQYEQIAAHVVMAATATTAERIPAGFTDRLQQAAQAHLTVDSVSRASGTEHIQAPASPRDRGTTLSMREAAAWLLAAALLGLLLVNQLVPDNTTPNDPDQNMAADDGRDGNDVDRPADNNNIVVDVPPDAVERPNDPAEQVQPNEPNEPDGPIKPIAPPTLEDQKRSLLAEEGVLEWKWLPSEDPAALVASGSVVWSNERQEGFLTFQKLAANDPQREQYQLWIIDGQRDPAQPVDGGVFDIQQTDAEVIVRIDAKLQVYDPQAFAVTIEKPGGVVVSDRSRLPLLASRDAI